MGSVSKEIKISYLTLTTDQLLFNNTITIMYTCDIFLKYKILALTDIVYIKAVLMWSYQ